MRKTLKGVSLIEIILSMAVYAVIALLLCQIMSTINLTMQSNSALERRFAAEAKYADGHNLPQSANIGTVYQVATDQQISDIKVTGNGVKLEVSTNGAMTVQSTQSITENAIASSLHDAHFKYIDFKPLPDSTMQVGEDFKFQINAGMNFNPNDLSSTYGSADNASPVNPNIGALKKVKISITDGKHMFGDPSDSSKRVSELTMDLTNLASGNPLFGSPLIIERKFNVPDNGDPPSDMLGTIYDPALSVIKVNVVLYGELKEDPGKGIVASAFDSGAFLPNTNLLQAAEFTLDLIDHNLVGYSAEAQKAENEDPEKAWSRTSQVFGCPTITLDRFNTTTGDADKGTGLDLSIAPNSPSAMYKAEDDKP